MDATQLSEIARGQQRLHHKQRAIAKRMTTPQGKAMEVVERNTVKAAQVLVDIMTDENIEPRDRRACAKDVLDMAGVGKAREQAAVPQIPMQFIAAALTGIAALSGQLMPGLGDLTNLSDRVAEANPEDIIDGEYEDAE